MRSGRALAGVAMIGLAALIWTGASPVSLVAGSVHERHEELAAGITAVRLDLGSGDVLIRTGDRERTSVTTRVRDRWWGGDGGTGHRREGDTLVLGDCDGCSADYDVVVPRGVTVTGENGSGDVVLQGVRSADVETGSGDVSVREVAGAVTAQSGSGEVDISRVGGPVDVETSSGSVVGSGLAGPVVAEASSGDVALRLTRAQDVRASTSSGDVALTVPDGRYRVDSDSRDDDDRADIGVIDDPDARYALDLSTSSGRIEVSTR